jgi:hypothetical protein
MVNGTQYSSTIVITEDPYLYWSALCKVLYQPTAIYMTKYWVPSITHLYTFVINSPRGDNNQVLNSTMRSFVHVYIFFAVSLVVLPAVRCFSPAMKPSKVTRSQLHLSADDSDDDDDTKFSFGQRIESTKAGIVGLIAGSLCLAPVSALHNILLGGTYVKNGLAQWELDTDVGSLEAALFAIVYRYCIRQDDNNPQLNQGVLGAFVLTRTFSKIQAPVYCSAMPLDCT